jgi:predicted MPP superfamily phosphohydrolase
VNLPIFAKDFMRRHYRCDIIYGHLVQGDRHLIISAGLGTTRVPVRFMRPPEVVELTIGGARPQS